LPAGKGIGIASRGFPLGSGSAVRAAAGVFGGASGERIRQGGKDTARGKGLTGCRAVPRGFGGHRAAVATAPRQSQGNPSTRMAFARPLRQPREPASSREAAGPSLEGADDRDGPRRRCLEEDLPAGPGGGLEGPPPADGRSRLVGRDRVPPGLPRLGDEVFCGLRSATPRRRLDAGVARDIAGVGLQEGGGAGKARRAVTSRAPALEGLRGRRPCGSGGGPPVR
jgi:hypothetical protein